MRWPWRKKVRIINVDSRHLLRSIIYDSGLGQPEDIIALLGGPPVSTEGAEYEREQSDLRVRAVSGLAPLLQPMASWIGAGCINELQEWGIEQMADEDTRSYMTVHYSLIAYRAIISTLSTLMDQGIIEYARPE